LIAAILAAEPKPIRTLRPLTPPALERLRSNRGPKPGLDQGWDRAILAARWEGVVLLRAGRKLRAVEEVKGSCLASLPIAMAADRAWASRQANRMQSSSSAPVTPLRRTLLIP
jgi:hypothetical protein